MTGVQTCALPISKYMNFNILLRNSIFGLLGFGVLGYLWGMYYERVVEPALMESHRNESQRRMEELKGNPNQRFLSDMSVDEVQPNMISISAVHNKDGALLVREGAKLTERMIQNLRANSIASIKVEAQHRQVSTDDY